MKVNEIAIKSISCAGDEPQNEKARKAVMESIERDGYCVVWNHEQGILGLTQQNDHGIWLTGWRGAFSEYTAQFWSQISAINIDAI